MRGGNMRVHSLRCICMGYGALKTLASFALATMTAVRGMIRVESETTKKKHVHLSSYNTFSCIHISRLLSNQPEKYDGEKPFEAKLEEKLNTIQNILSHALTLALEVGSGGISTVQPQENNIKKTDKKPHSF